MDIGLQFPISLLDPLLEIGATLAIVQSFGNIPERVDMLQIFANDLAITGAEILIQKLDTVSGPKESFCFRGLNRFQDRNFCYDLKPESGVNLRRQITIIIRNKSTVQLFANG